MKKFNPDNILELAKRPEGFSCYKYSESHFYARIKVKELEQKGVIQKIQEKVDKIIYKHVEVLK